MKKILKWIGILAALLIVLLVVAGVVFMLVVDKEMIAGQMAPFLHRQVTLEEIQVGIFSVVSGIEVKGIRVSNYKTTEQLESLQGKPVPDKDLFAALKSLTLKLKFLPLLSGNAELSELVLYEPVVNVVRYRNGKFNFSDLLAPREPETKKEEPSPAKPKPAQEEKAAEPSSPITADILPVSVTLGKLGIEKGTILYADRKFNQAFQIYNLTFLAHSAEIDPAALETKNQVKIKFESGIKPTDKLKTGAVELFDIGLAANGWVKPFDVKTRLLDPEVSLELESPYGTLTGLRILKEIQSVRALEQFTGKLAFLKDDVQWKKAGVEAWYKAGTAKLSSGRIPTDDYTLDLAGALNTKTQAMDLDLGMELSEKENEVVRSSIEKNVSKQISGDVAKYVPPEKITDMVMKRLVNKNGKIFLVYKVTGTPKAPKPRLVSPELPALDQLVKEVAGDAVNIAAEAAKKEADKAIDKAKGDLEKELKKSLDFKF
jgi:hypothetical protein